MCEGRGKKENVTGSHKEWKKVKKQKDEKCNKVHTT